MKHFYLLAVLIILSISGYTQGIESNPQFRKEINHLFQHLDKSKVPTGLLKDYAFEVASLENYAGQLTDSNYVSPYRYFDLLRTTRSAQIAGTPLLPADSLALRWERRQSGRLVFMGMLYRYAYIVADAIQAGKLRYVNNQAYDNTINGVWQNPYATAHVLAIAPADSVLNGLSHKLVLPAGFWQSNESLKKLEVDAGDGKGFRTFSVNTPLDISYPAEGRKTIVFRATLQNGKQLLTHSAVIIKGAIRTARFAGTPEEVISVTSDEAFEGKRAYGYITIRYASQDRKLRKPFIVAEGFDPGHILSPKEQFGDNRIENFVRDIRNVRNGSNVINEYLSNQNYDLVYVDWRNGTDDIRRNAKLLKTAIKLVNQRKASSGSTEKNVIIGQSMGGLVTRWALKEMENEKKEHECRMFISHDVPHLGANIPIGIQYMANHLLDEYIGKGWIKKGAGVLVDLFSSAKPSLMLAMAHTPAARQMLINYVNVDGNIDNSFHDQWQQQLNQLGFPQGASATPLKMVAISNGSACATRSITDSDFTLLSMSGNMHTRFLGDIVGMAAAPFLSAFTHKVQFLLGKLPGRNDIDIDLRVKAAAEYGGNSVYYHKAVYKKTFLWILPIRVKLWDVNKTAPTDILPIERYGGGQYDLSIVNLNDINIKNVFAKANIRVTKADVFNFVPTPSALCIDKGSRTLTRDDYGRMYTTFLQKSSDITPFSYFITANNANEAHISFNNTNGNWLVNEMRGVSNTINCPPCGSYTWNTLKIEGVKTASVTDTFTLTGYNIPTVAKISWSLDGSDKDYYDIEPLFPNGKIAILKKKMDGKWTDGSLFIRASLAAPCLPDISIISESLREPIHSIALRNASWNLSENGLPIIFELVAPKDLKEPRNTFSSRPLGVPGEAFEIETERCQARIVSSFERMKGTYVRVEYPAETDENNPPIIKIRLKKANSKTRWQVFAISETSKYVNLDPPIEVSPENILGSMPSKAIQTLAGNTIENPETMPGAAVLVNYWNPYSLKFDYFEYTDRNFDEVSPASTYAKSPFGYFQFKHYYGLNSLPYSDYNFRFDSITGVLSASNKFSNWDGFWIRYVNENRATAWQFFYGYHLPKHNGYYVDRDGLYSYYRLSPNPSASYFTISPGMEESTTGVRSSRMASLSSTPVAPPTFNRIIITDAMGNVKLSQTVSSTTSYRVDVSRLPNGIYYLQLLSGSKVVEQKTLSVKR